MTYPVDVGTLSIYMGNPYSATFIFEDADYSAFTFRSQIRSTPSDGIVKAEWTISQSIVDTDTVLTMSLTGDPAIGSNIGQTRLIGSRAFFDVERIASNGAPVETMITGTLAVTQDVTR